MMTMRKSCGVIPFFVEGGEVKVLLLEHVSGHWGFPKGGQERGEADFETATRELQEEVGITDFKVLEDFRRRGGYEFEAGWKTVQKEVIYFLGRVPSKDVTVQASELRSAQWLGVEEARRRLSHPEIIEILEAAVGQFNKWLGS